MNQRRTFSAEEKYRILEEGRQPGVKVAEVCRRYGIASSLYYRWEAQVREAALEALADSRGRQGRAQEREIDRLKDDLTRKNSVIAELSEALVQEKRGLSDYLTPRGSQRR